MAESVGLVPSLLRSVQFGHLVGTVPNALFTRLLWVYRASLHTTPMTPEWRRQGVCLVQGRHRVPAVAQECPLRKQRKAKGKSSRNAGKGGRTRVVRT